MFDEMCFSDFSAKKIIQKVKTFFKEGVLGLHRLLAEEGIDAKERTQRFLVAGVAGVIFLAYLSIANHYVLDIVNHTDLPMVCLWVFAGGQLALGAILLCYVGANHELLLADTAETSRPG